MQAVLLLRIPQGSVAKKAKGRAKGSRFQSQPLLEANTAWAGWGRELALGH